MLCFAADCNHQSMKETCSFFRFPKDKKMRALWADRCRRVDRDPSDSSRLCSCHFKDGDRKNKPTEFSYKQDKSFNFTSPEKSKQRNPNVPNNCKTIVPVECETTGNTENVPGPSEVKNYKLDLLLLEAEVNILRKENALLKKELEQNKMHFSFERIKEKPELVLMYTGLSNAEAFYLVLSYLQRFQLRYYSAWVSQMPLEEQLFITLQKLRLNYNFKDLAERYSVSVSTVRNIFFTLVNAIHATIFEFIFSDVNSKPSVEKVKETSPLGTSFPNCRFLLDCTEVHIETPRMDMEAQRQSYSSYKKGQTAKALVAVSPSGRICFCSKLFPGSYSDKVIVQKSGLLEALNPGDLIIADKGFLIRDILPKGVSLNLPPFLLNPQFSEEEVKYTTKIARARIHVERSIQRIKSFQILHGVSHNFKPFLTKIFQVCVTLVNLQTPVLADESDL